MRSPSSLDHRCTLPSKDSSQLFLPPLPPDAGRCERLLRHLHLSIYISEHNPRCGVFYRSRGQVMALKRRQAEANSIVIHPLSMFRLYYEMWMAVVTILCLTYLPLEAAFGILETASGTVYKTCLVINSSLKFFTLVDVVFNFLTGYVNEAEKTIIMDPVKIVFRYIFSIHLICDLLTSLPDPKFYTNDIKIQRAIDLLNLLKIVRLKTAYNYVSRTSIYFRCRGRFYQTAKLVFFTFLVFHWTACIHYLVPQLRYIFNGKYDKGSWILRWKEVIDMDLFSKYVRCFYKATGYMLTIRFEQITLLAWEEYLIGCLTYTVGKFFLLYVAVKLIQIFLDNRSTETKYMELMNQLDAFMDCKRFPSSMRRRIIQNYEYKYGGGYFKEEKIKDLLPEKLKREINTQVLIRLVRNVPMFQDLPQSKLQQVLAHLKPEIYLANDLIIRCGSQGDEMYFLYSGTVCIYTPSGKEVCHLKDGDYFGEITMILKENRRTASVVALEICEVYKMSKKGFFTCFRDNKDLLKKIREEAIIRLEVTEMYESIRKAMHQQKENKFKPVI